MELSDFKPDPAEYVALCYLAHRYRQRERIIQPECHNSARRLRLIERLQERTDEPPTGDLTPWLEQRVRLLQDERQINADKLRELLKPCGLQESTLKVTWNGFAEPTLAGAPDTATIWREAERQHQGDALEELALNALDLGGRQAVLEAVLKDEKGELS